MRPRLCLAWLFSVSFSGKNSIDHRSEVSEVVGLLQESFDGRMVENPANFKVLRLAALLGRRRETRLAVTPGKWPPSSFPFFLLVALALLLRLSQRELERCAGEDLPLGRSNPALEDGVLWLDIEVCYVAI